MDRFVDKTHQAIRCFIVTEVVRGNQDAIDRHLCVLGDSRELTEWFALRQEGGDTA